MDIEGETFMFTGRLSITRNEAQELVEKAGGIAGNSLSRNTNYLVVGEKPGSKLTIAGILGVRTITEEEFFEMLQEATGVLLPDEVELTYSPPEELELLDERDYSYREPKVLAMILEEEPQYTKFVHPGRVCPHCNTDIPYTISVSSWYCFNCSLHSYPEDIAREDIHHHTFSIEEIHMWGTSVIKELCQCGCGAALYLTHTEYEESKITQSHANYNHSLEFAIKVSKHHEYLRWLKDRELQEQLEIWYNSNLGENTEVVENTNVVFTDIPGEKADYGADPGEISSILGRKVDHVW